MNRRDFLLLRAEPRPREYELSCERLYLQCLDIQATEPQPDDTIESFDASLWAGEPPASFIGPTREELFHALDLELREVDVLRVVNTQWLVGDLRHDFDRLMDGFRARGGRVEIH